MANLNGDIKKWKRYEIMGTLATVFCGVVAVYFAVCFPIASVKGLKDLQLIVLISAPVLIALGSALAAFCNLKYGGLITKAIRQYVLDVFVENAEAMHPERKSLTFYAAMQGSAVELTVNGYKEKITFDFSAFGKLSLPRKAAILTEIENRLCVTFCRLYGRGAEYVDVGYTEREGTGKKSGKIIPVIINGEPDKRAYKIYLKNK